MVESTNKTAESEVNARKFTPGVPYWHSLLPGGKPVQISTKPDDFN